MSLTMIIGPMKSGKSLELIARVAPYKYTKQKVALLQPKLNVRDQHVQSRQGLKMKAQKVSSLAEYKGEEPVIGVDEMHMFPASDAKVVQRWLSEGRDVFLCGLDLSGYGTMFKTSQAFLELKPDLLIDKKAVCDYCGVFDARFTRIEKDGVVLRRGQAVLPEDGTHEYKAACRTCFYAALRN